MKTISRRLLWLLGLLTGGGGIWMAVQLDKPEYNLAPWQLVEFLAPSLLEVFPSLLPDGVPADADLDALFTLPASYSIELYARDLGPVRVLRFTAYGDLLASVPRRGQVILIPRISSGQAGDYRVLLEDLNRPHGLELHNGWLYIGETDAVARIRLDAESGTVSGELERVLTGLPAGGNHWTRTLRLGPDGWLYLQVGSSCNVCLEEDERRASMMRVRPDGSGAEIYASGLRNTVGWDWQPGSGAMYGVDNGRDMLGDDFPPGEVNLISPGNFYGWPFYNGANRPDPDLGDHPALSEKTPVAPVYELDAHSAPLSLHFLRPPFPPGLEEAALVSLHGSWNRSKKSGYKLVSLHWDEDGEWTEKPFLTGFEKDEEVSGRPVDIVRGPDGAIYVSDDYSRAVYRISWAEAATDGI